MKTLALATALAIASIPAVAGNLPPEWRPAILACRSEIVPKMCWGAGSCSAVWTNIARCAASRVYSNVSRAEINGCVGEVSAVMSNQPMAVDRVGKVLECVSAAP